MYSYYPVRAVLMSAYRRLRTALQVTRAVVKATCAGCQCQPESRPHSRLHASAFAYKYERCGSSVDTIAACNRQRTIAIALRLTPIVFGFMYIFVCMIDRTH